MTPVLFPACDALEPYSDTFDHIADELRRLDLLVRLRVLEFRDSLRVSRDTAPAGAMYISHEEIDVLFEIPDAVPVSSETQELQDELCDLDRQIRARVEESQRRSVFLAIPRLVQTFGLSVVEAHTLIVCLAPELDRKYDKLYAYLQDDITRRKPSVDLALDLLNFGRRERWQARIALTSACPLFRTGLVQITEDGQSPSGSSDLARMLKLDARVLNYICGLSTLDVRVAGFAEIQTPGRVTGNPVHDESLTGRALRLIERSYSGRDAGRKRVVLYLRGPYGAGQHELVLSLCRELHCPLIRTDVEAILAREGEFENFVHLLFREGLLLQGALYLEHADLLMEDEPRAKMLRFLVARNVLDYGWLTFLSGERRFFPSGLFRDAVFHQIAMPLPGPSAREAAWKAELDTACDESVHLAGTLANQFRLTPGQIRDAGRLARAAGAAGDGTICSQVLFEACREVSNHKLGDLSVQVEPRCKWEDLVLPQDTLGILREICDQVRYRRRVFEDWGFERRLSRGKGLSALFYGPPGTGKTLAAEVLAHDLQLDLYKVELSSVISKYIGETEKNLTKIFQEAESSNAILFFDEADALFGKRTEISDAHDRYANVEISHLLQKMEEYEGIAILASNFRENMDDAFVRRIRFIVEFPFPDAASRLLMWKNHFPHETPLSDDIDYEHLSVKYKITGGSIRNVALNAAFRAAADSSLVATRHIVQAMRREYEKIGKLWTEES